MWIVWIKFGPTFERSGTRETWDDPQQTILIFGRVTKKWCFVWECSRVHFNDLKLTTRADTRQLIFERGFRLPSVWSWRKDTSRTKIMIYDMMDLALQFVLGGRSPQRLNKGNLRGAMSLEADWCVLPGSHRSGPSCSVSWAGFAAAKWVWAWNDWMEEL